MTAERPRRTGLEDIKAGMNQAVTGIAETIVSEAAVASQLGIAGAILGAGVGVVTGRGMFTEAKRMAVAGVKVGAWLGWAGAPLHYNEQTAPKEGLPRTGLVDWVISGTIALNESKKPANTARGQIGQLLGPILYNPTTVSGLRHAGWGAIRATFGA